MTLTVDEDAQTPIQAGRGLAAVTAGIVAYPLVLIAARQTGPGGAVAFLALAFGLPALGATVAWAGRGSSPNAVFQRRVGHLAFAAPSLYVAAGPYFAFVKLSAHELVAWAALWLAAAAVLFARAPAAERTMAIPVARPRLRAVHGVVAASLILAFLGVHLANHLSALLSTELQRVVMTTLRLWYRSPLVQPVLVAGFLFMMASGLVLARSRTAVATDALGLLQTLTGGYVAAFLVSHLTSTFAARSRGTNTDWSWATSAPEGLLAGYDRLIPHYTLGVACLIAHLGCGLRTVLLQHDAPQAWADGVAWTVASGGVLLAVAIMAGMFGVRL